MARHPFDQSVERWAACRDAAAVIASVAAEWVVAARIGPEVRTFHGSQAATAQFHAELLRRSPVSLASMPERVAVAAVGLARLLPALGVEDRRAELVATYDGIDPVAVQHLLEAAVLLENHRS